MEENFKENVTSRVESFMSLNVLPGLSAAINFPHILGRMTRRLLSTIQDSFGFELGFRVPGYLAQYNLELWEGLTVIDRLVKHGVATDFRELPQKYPDEPRLIRYSVRTKDAQHYGHSGHGYDFFSHKKAMWAAIGEAVERFSLTHFLPQVKEYCDAEYHKVQLEAIDIFSIAGISKAQRRVGHPRFNLQFDVHSYFRWIKGYSLTRERKIWVPLQLVTFVYTAPSERKEPLILLPVSTGAASQRSMESAVLNGLLEAIERDAFMITWVNKLSPPIIDCEHISNDQLQDIFQRLRRYRLEFYLLYLPTDIPVHAVLALIIDRSGVGPAVSVGASANISIFDAMRDAITEAFASRVSVRAMLEEQVRKTKFELPDRRFLDRDGRLLWWCPTERLSDITFLIKGERKRLTDLPRHPSLPAPSKALRFLVNVLKAKNLEVVYSEIIERDLQKYLGLSAVVVTVPGLQPMHLDESLPYEGGKRLADVPTALGFRVSATPNPLPHPFP